VDEEPGRERHDPDHHFRLAHTRHDTHGDESILPQLVVDSWIGIEDASGSHFVLVVGKEARSSTWVESGVFFSLFVSASGYW